MNSIVLDYKTPGADLAPIPAMREYFIGCIYTSANWFLTVDVITVVLLNEALCFSRDRTPVCSAHRSESVCAVQQIYEGFHLKADKQGCVTSLENDSIF